ncbi:MAG TPA: hypothetical protein DDY13_07365 [Cytophagales bacterium]|jgi:nucleotide-binding universal stress UspA family protein|nr:hypothetical protein [Cytophagales bacterium]
MKKILVPTDYSELADYAFNLASLVSENDSTEIHSLKVVEAPGETLFDKEGNLLDCTEYDVKPLKEEAKKAEEQMEAWLGNKPGNPHGIVQIGHLTDNILKYVEKHDIDLVVMGTHGATGFKELISGSHTERIVRNAEAPVLTLKCDRSQMKVRNILLPSNFTEHKKQNLQMVKKLQQNTGAAIHLLKVNTERDFCTNHEAMEEMKQFARDHELNNVTYNIYCDKSVEDGIVHYAQENAIDIVAIGTHGRKGISHWLRGSITEDIVNHVYMPILTYKI